MEPLNKIPSIWKRIFKPTSLESHTQSILETMILKDMAQDYPELQKQIIQEITNLKNKNLISDSLVNELTTKLENKPSLSTFRNIIDDIRYISGIAEKKVNYDPRVSLYHRRLAVGVPAAGLTTYALWPNNKPPVEAPIEAPVKAPVETPVNSLVSMLNNYKVTVPTGVGLGALAGYGVGKNSTSALLGAGIGGGVSALGTYLNNKYKFI